MMNIVMETVYSAIIFLTPLAIACFILIKFKRDDVAKYIGFLSLIPVLIIVILNLLEPPWGFKIGTIYYYEIEGFIWLLLELIPLAVVVYHSRRLFRKEKLFRAFIAGSIVRWLYLFVFLVIPSPSPEPYFNWQLYLELFFAIFFPMLYAIAGLIFVRKRYARDLNDLS